MAGQNGTTTAVPRLSAEDERKFLIAGMEDEKTKLRARMDYLDTHINAMKQSGVLGAPATVHAASPVSPSGPKPPKGRGKRRITAEAREKMASAQRERWRKIREAKAAQQQSAAAAPPSPLDTGEARA